MIITGKQKRILIINPFGIGGCFIYHSVNKSLERKIPGLLYRVLVQQEGAAIIGSKP